MLLILVVIISIYWINDSNQAGPVRQENVIKVCRKEKSNFFYLDFYRFYYYLDEMWLFITRLFFD
jgi:hypothetical protein